MYFFIKCKNVKLSDGSLVSAMRKDSSTLLALSKKYLIRTYSMLSPVFSLSFLRPSHVFSIFACRVASLAVLLFDVLIVHRL